MNRRRFLIAATGLLVPLSALADRRKLLTQAVGQYSTPLHRINVGGSAVSPYSAETGFVSGGTIYVDGNTYTTSGLTDPAPNAVYQAERYGAGTTITMSGLTEASYRLRLHLAEGYHTSAGSRVCNILVNGATRFANYDAIARTGARYKVDILSFIVSPNASNQIVITFSAVVDNPSIRAVELYR